MLMDPMGGIVMTNDGNAILREVWFLSIEIQIQIQIQVMNTTIASVL